jgi:hypothetical protein
MSFQGPRAVLSGSSLPAGTPANFGIETDSGSFLLSAIRDFAISLSSPNKTRASSFDVSQITAEITSGQVNYFSDSASQLPGGPFNGVDAATPIAGSLLFQPGAGAIVDASDIETLSIPFAAGLSIDSIDLGMPGAFDTSLELNLTGTIVATTAVPEPALFGFLAGSILFCLRRPRTNRFGLSGRSMCSMCSRKRARAASRRRDMRWR